MIATIIEVVRLTAVSLIVGALVGLTFAQAVALGPVERAFIGGIIGTGLILWCLAQLAARIRG